MRLVQRLKWAIVGFVEPEIQTLITERIVRFHERMVADGVIQRGSVARRGLQANQPVPQPASSGLPQALDRQR